MGRVPDRGLAVNVRGWGLVQGGGSPHGRRTERHGGYRRRILQRHRAPANAKEDRVDHRLKRNQSADHRVVVALRERCGWTLPFMTTREADGVACSAVMSADEASHRDMPHNGWHTERVNHSVIYSDHGKHTSWVESCFSRIRRMVTGQRHHVSPRYLYTYANQAAWLEDHRSETNGELTAQAVTNAMHSPVSRTWKGYWQRLTFSHNARLKRTSSESHPFNRMTPHVTSRVDRPSGAFRGNSDTSRAIRAARTAPPRSERAEGPSAARRSSAHATPCPSPPRLPSTRTPVPEGAPAREPVHPVASTASH